MKVKFMYKTLFLLALVLSFFSCKQEADDLPTPSAGDATKSVVLKLANSPTTYQDQVTAGGVTPNLNNGTIFFIGNGKIIQKNTFSTADVATLTGAGKVYTVPVYATSAYIVADANATTSLPALTTATVGTTFTALKALLLDITAQANSKTYCALQGEGTVTTSAVNVDLYPATSRIEIKEVSIKSGATYPITAFTLQGIFINNTFMKLGLDYTTKSALPADVVNLMPADTAKFNATYPGGTYLYDYAVTGIGGTTTTKKPTNVWTYPVFPAKVEAKAGAGKTPHIILRLTGITSTPALPAPTMYLTIGKFIDKTTSQPITEFSPGKVYSIESIAFGGEHLSDKPAVPSQNPLTVTVTVKAWESQIVTPDL